MSGARGSVIVDLLLAGRLDVAPAIRFEIPVSVTAWLLSRSGSELPCRSMAMSCAWL